MTAAYDSFLIFYSLSFRPFSLDSFDVYAKHFTVMNYKDSENLKQVREQPQNWWQHFLSLLIDLPSFLIFFAKITSFALHVFHS